MTKQEAKSKGFDTPLTNVFRNGHDEAALAKTELQVKRDGVETVRVDMKSGVQLWRRGVKRITYDQQIKGQSWKQTFYKTKSGETIKT